MVMVPRGLRVVAFVVKRFPGELAVLVDVPSDVLVSLVIEPID